MISVLLGATGGCPLGTESLPLGVALQSITQPSVDADNSEEGISHVPAVAIRVRVR